MKKKTLVLIGIAVFTMLLASPVLASAGYSKIYGNANEDDVLDMRDVTYIKLVIFGKKPVTAFADANYDGKISMLDIGQTKLIILGKEKRLTLVDMADRTVTVPRPIERMVVLSMDGLRTILSLVGCDNLVGVSSSVNKYYGPEFIVQPFLYPKLKELPGIGTSGQENMEIIVSLKPDVIFGSTSYADKMQESTGVPVVCAKAYGATGPEFSSSYEAFRLGGKVVEKEDEAEELISYINEKIEEITEVTSEIPEAEKPKVFLYFWRREATPIRYDPVDLAGGINVAKDLLPGSSVIGDVSKEQIVAWNPDIIFLHRLMTYDPSHPYTIEGRLADPLLQPINAIKNRRVYYTKGFMSGWDPATGLTEVFYMAKLFHPDKFEDLDVEKEGNEILKKFYGADGIYTYMAGYCRLHRWD